MKRRHRRLWLAMAAVMLAGLAALLVLRGLEQSVTFFYSPSDLSALAEKPQTRIRVGGLVADGSLQAQPGSEYRFDITDLNDTLTVSYVGLLPNLFREGQGVVASGQLGPNGMFVADEVLAKHDETYMPPEVAAAIKDRGEWREDTAPATGPPDTEPPPSY